MFGKRPTAYDGTDLIGKMPELTKEEKHQQEILQDNFFNCFSTEEGKKVLKHLEKYFLSQPVAMPEKSAEHAYFREGENNIIRYIKLRIKQSKKRRQNNG